MTSTEHFRLLGGLLPRRKLLARGRLGGRGADHRQRPAHFLRRAGPQVPGFTTGGADELSSYAFAISTSWALAFATLQRANVRVDVLYQFLPVRLSAVLDWLSLVALAVFMVFLTYYAYDMVQTSWAQKSAANTPLATPLWIPQGLWLLGLAWMCLTVALMLARASAALVTGDIELVKQICGVRSAQEEADEEAAAGERMVKGEAA